MPEIYYPDIAFCVNFFLDYIMLFVVKCIRKLPAGKGRRCLAAVCGSTLAVTVTAFFTGRGGRFLAVAIGAVLMCLIAFGKRGIRKNVLTLWASTFVMGGMIFAACALLAGGVGHENEKLVPAAFQLGILTAAAAGIVLVVRKMQAQGNAAFVYSVQFFIGETSYCCRGLLDTGNGLYEPFRKKPVLLLVDPVFCEPLKALCEKQPEKVCYVPYRAVGKSEGILTGAELLKVMIKTDKEEIMLSHVPAAYAEMNARNGNYQVILHPDFFADVDFK